jgi:hypothetical protein
MKKLLFTIVLLFIFSLSFAQNQNLLSSNVELNIKTIPPQTQEQNNYELQNEIKRWRNKGITNLVCGATWTGLGVTCLVLQPNPNYYYSTSTYFWTGVTLVTIGGIEMIYGWVQLGHASVLLSRSKQITLTPSNNNIGIAINF